MTRDATQQTKRPAFQFYPGDWQRDTALRSCSLTARGLWIEMLCLMHDGAPYGHLTTAAGAAITPAQLARMVGEPEKKVRAWLAELETAGVFSRTDDAGVIYSRRMVKDEHHRTVRAAGGKESLHHPNVPRPKADARKDPPQRKGRIPSARPSARPSASPSSPSFRPSLGGSPAVAVAVASADQEQLPPPADAVGASNGRGANGNGRARHDDPPAPPPAPNPESAVVVSSARYPHFPKASCDRLHAAWVAHKGGVPYARFRKAFGESGLFPATGPQFPDAALEAAIAAAVEVTSTEGGYAARSLTPETFVGNVVEWVRLGAQSLVDEWGELTERGRRAGVAV